MSDRRLTVAKTVSLPKATAAAFAAAAAREGMTFSGLLAYICKEWLKCAHPDLLAQEVER